MRQGCVSGGRGWCVGFLGDECGVRWGLRVCWGLVLRKKERLDSTLDVTVMAWPPCCHVTLGKKCCNSAWGAWCVVDGEMVLCAATCDAVRCVVLGLWWVGVLLCESVT
jgi:hypothetical protein